MRLVILCERSERPGLSFIYLRWIVTQMFEYFEKKLSYVRKGKQTEPNQNIYLTLNP